MKKRVMIVDDSKIMCKRIAGFLENSDFEVAGFCHSGEEAVAQYPVPQPDVVTMDVVMPGEDGMEAAKKIRELDPNARILMVTSLAYDSLINEAVAIGVKSFIFKPFDRERLLDNLIQASADKK